MQKSKQNLFLFFEENELEFEISSSLVQLSMNRFVIDEDDQFEVIGIYNLTKATKEMANFDDPADKYFAKERTEKQAYDKVLISEAIDQAALHPLVDSHFIIGTYFHRIFVDWNKYLPASSMLFDWISDEIKKNDIQSIQCTLYHGVQVCLVSNELSVARYENDVCIDIERFFSISHTPNAIWSKSQFSVHDDVERLIKHIKPDYPRVQELELFRLTCSEKKVE